MRRKLRDWVLQNTSLRGQVAGESAMASVVASQKERAPRGRLARFLGFSPLSAAAYSHYRAALGELLVGSVLDRLDHSWDVLHGVPLNSGTLEHFIVGRPGVFAISVINCQGDEVTVTRNGLVVARHSTDAIVRSRQAAAEVELALNRSQVASRPIHVSAILVLVKPVKVSGHRGTPGVSIVSSMQLEQCFLRANNSLSGDEVAAISAAAERAETWPQPATKAERARELTRAFVQLHRDVRQAQMRRFFWVVGALIVTFTWVWAWVSILATALMSEF